MAAIYEVTIDEPQVMLDTGRFYCPGGADHVLNQHDSAIIWYDGTSSRWREMGV